MEVNFDEELLIGMRVDPDYDEPVLDQVLRIAVYDEYHAYETYRKILDTFGDVRPFSNIMEAEVRHYSALIPLLEKYGVPIPFDNWYERIELPDTLQECCEVGVAAEIENMRMYDDLLQYVDEYPDIQDVLFRLQAASNNNHLPTFRACVQSYSEASTDVNGSDVRNASTGNGEEMMDRVNEFSAIAQKFATGQASQEDVMNILGKTNLSFIGGILLGGAGAAVLAKVLKDKEET